MDTKWGHAAAASIARASIAVSAWATTARQILNVLQDRVQPAHVVAQMGSDAARTILTVARAHAMRQLWHAAYARYMRQVVTAIKNVAIRTVQLVKVASVVASRRAGTGVKLESMTSVVARVSVIARACVLNACQWDRNARKTPNVAAKGVCALTPRTDWDLIVRLASTSSAVQQTRAAVTSSAIMTMAFAGPKRLSRLLSDWSALFQPVFIP